MVRINRIEALERVERLVAIVVATGTLHQAHWDALKELENMYAEGSMVRKLHAAFDMRLEDMTLREALAELEELDE